MFSDPKGTLTERGNNKFIAGDFQILVRFVLIIEVVPLLM